MDFLSSPQYKKFEDIIFENYSGLSKEEQAIIMDKYNLISMKRSEILNLREEIKNENRPLRIGFVGGFSTGKSSIINSIIGEDLLGVKVEPATARITELKYGNQFKILEVHQESETFKYKEIDIKTYKKVSVSRKVENKISHYIIKYPSENLSRFTIIDTPGFSSISKEDDALTKKWISNLDLLIWTFDINKVGDSDEYKLMKQFCSNGKKTIGIINKADQKSPSVRKNIQNEIIDIGLIDEIYFFSARKVNEFKSKICKDDQIWLGIAKELKSLIFSGKEFKLENRGNELMVDFKGENRLDKFQFDLPIKDDYISLYNQLINKLDTIREEEISVILQNTFKKKIQNLNESINKLLVYLRSLSEISKEELEINIDIDIEEKEKLNDNYDIIWERFKQKIDVFDKSFCADLFNGLGKYLFFKSVDEGLFYDDVYISMVNLNDEVVFSELRVYIDKKFNHFLSEVISIYKKEISKTSFEKYSNIEEFNNDENDRLNGGVKDLISFSASAIMGYFRNFKYYKTNDFLSDRDFHQISISKIIPDEPLYNAVVTTIFYDLDDSYNKIIQEYEKEIKSKSNLILKAKGQINGIEKLLEEFNELKPQKL